MFLERSEISPQNLTFIHILERGGEGGTYCTQSSQELLQNKTINRSEALQLQMWLNGMRHWEERMDTIGVFGSGRDMEGC